MPILSFSSFKSYYNSQKEIKVNFNQSVENNDWINLSVLEDAEDFICIEPEDYSQDSEVKKISQSAEINAKFDSYQGAINNEEFNKLKAEFKSKGYELTLLGTEDIRNKGIYLYALTNEKDPNAPITILCRGTALDASIIADLDPNFPGNKLFLDNKNIILEQIDELAIDKNSIRITGHSLGGALAQLVTHGVLESKKEKNHVNLSKISKVETIVFQAAGVNQGIANEVKENLTAIKSEEHDFSMKFIAHIKKGDLVPKISGTYLFSDVPPGLAEVYLMMRNFDKSFITTSDVLKIASSIFINQNIMPVVKEEFPSILKRNLKAYCLDTHSECFYHNIEDKTESNLVYGYYSNFDQLGRDKIKNVFEKDWLNSVARYVPLVGKIQSCIFNLVNGYENQDVKNAVDVVASSYSKCKEIYNNGKLLFNVAQVAVDATKSTDSILGKIGKISRFVRLI